MVNARAGKGGLGCMLSFVMLAALGWFGYRIGTKYWSFYEFQDQMLQESHFAAVRSDLLIARRLKDFADSLRLPEGASKVTVRRRRGTIQIWADYDVIIKFPGFSRTLHFHPEAVGTY